MKKLNLKRTEKEKSNFFGMFLPKEYELFFKRQLEELSERCPSSAKLHLNFEKRKSCIKGTLSIKSYSQDFHSTKVAVDPLQTFLLMQEDIENQLFEWKHKRFKDLKKTHLYPNLTNLQSCA